MDGKDTTHADVATTRRKAAFRRFAEAHPRYHGRFLNDCFFDEAKEALRVYDPLRIDPDDPRWDEVCKEVRDE